MVNVSIYALKILLLKAYRPLYSWSLFLWLDVIIYYCWNEQLVIMFDNMITNNVITVIYFERTSFCGLWYEQQHKMHFVLKMMNQADPECRQFLKLFSTHNFLLLGCWQRQIKSNTKITKHLLSHSTINRSLVAL